MVRIRAHHLICLLGFKGFGYSEVHIKKMWELQSLLLSPSDSKFEVSDSPDYVCSVCPWLKEGKCHWEDKDIEAQIKERDNNVMARLGLKLGSTYTWRETLERIKASFEEGDLLSICGSCHWFPYGYCSEGLRKIKVRYDRK